LCEITYFKPLMTFLRPTVQPVQVSKNIKQGGTNVHGRLSHICHVAPMCTPYKKGKGKGFPYSIPSVGSGADLVVQAVSPQVTVSYPSGGRLPLLSTRPAVTSPTAEHHRPLDGTKLYCLVTEAHRCEQLCPRLLRSVASSRI